VILHKPDRDPCVFNPSETHVLAICAMHRRRKKKEKKKHAHSNTHTHTHTHCCDLHTSARTSASGGSAFLRPLFLRLFCCREKRVAIPRAVPFPVPSTGSGWARLGLWNNRRPPGRLGGVCEPRLRTGARLAECCVLANTQLACLSHANGRGARRPEECRINAPPPTILPFATMAFSLHSRRFRTPSEGDWHLSHVDWHLDSPAR